MKSYLLFIVTFLFLFGCQEAMVEEHLTADEKAPADTSEGVFVHITKGPDHPHEVWMGLQMAGIMSESRDVLVYFDIKGVEVVVKNAPDIVFKDNPGSTKQLAKLRDAGVTIMVCPGCLKAAGYTEADVMEGIEIADKDRFFDFTSGRILTIDY